MQHTERVHPSLLFHPGALLSLPELASARLDGLLIEVGDAYLPADLPDDAAVRIASLRPLLVDGFAASGPTAAWVHGYGDAPPRCHHLQRHSPKRRRLEPTPLLVLHDRQLDATDIELCGGFAVTTKVRTFTDLVRSAAADSEYAQWMHRMAAAEPALVLRVRAELAARHRLPGKIAALAVLDELLAA